MDKHDEHSVVALPGWWSTIAQAEMQTAQAVRDLRVRAACTHVADGIALVTVDAAGAVQRRLPDTRVDRWAGMARDAIADHESHYGGRLFVFPGQADLKGAMTAAELLERTVIDELVVPGHPGRVPDDTIVEGLDHVRPVFRQGQVVLTMRPVRPGVFQPFERRRPVGMLRPLG